MSIQQTVLRVQTNIPNATITGTTQFTTLDLYGDIPIKINKSVAEIQDISKRNSDLSIGLTLPGSKNNNRFFEAFYNVDTISLYFNPTSRVSCDVLLNDQSYFRGYLRLNKINVLNSKVEYDVTLYSTVGNLFGEIGNNLLQDLDFDDNEYPFNHTFSLTGVTNFFGQSNFYKDSEYPYPYFYPIVHNGYEYSGNTINFSGVTSGQTRLYTSTSPIGSFNSYTAATSAGVEEYRINSPLYPLRDNQLKPALNVWSLIKLIFKTYGYEIKSDFMNTPWIKSLYLYGYFSYEGTKFGWKVNNIQELPPEGVEIYYQGGFVGNPGFAVVIKKGTGIPCFCTEDINLYIPLNPPGIIEQGTIKAGTSLYNFSFTGVSFIEQAFVYASSADGIEIGSRFFGLSYFPKNVGDTAQYNDGDNVTFDLVIDQNIKQIDLISSIAKKFNLVFIPDPENSNQIIIEPYDYYIGTGNIYDWTPKLSYDKGFTVEPAQNFIESSLLLTDLEDGDEGNREFKNRVNRIYGRNIVYNPTDFKSQEKKIDTIFSPELIRRWDDNIGLPLGINYSATSEIDKVDNQVRWAYKGVKTKPKLFYWVGTANPFIDDVNEVYSTTGTSVNTYTVKVAPSSTTGTTSDSNERIPVVSHTMPLGLSDSKKINNDSLSILFNSELPVDIGVQTYNTYTENDAYNTFYRTRINNIYNPNTRVVSGYFDLKYSDVQNLQWNDIIKINEQYFTINKINEFNLTNRELTKVELIQLNLNPQQYLDRYFKYTYCDQPGYCFKLKTDFTNPNLQDTNFIWSTYYDQQVGSLTGAQTGFTSTFRIFNTGSVQVEYVPYTMQEISETDYLTGSCYNSTCDTMLDYIYGNINGLNYSLASFWENTAGTFKGTNLWPNCSGFSATNSTYVITTGSSTTYGINPCLATPTPTPTPTITPTPTVTPTPTITPTPLPETCFFTGATGGEFQRNPESVLYLQLDGKLLSDGWYSGGTQYGVPYSGGTAYGYKRLNEDGTLDTSYPFYTTTGITNQFYQPRLVYSDGKTLLTASPQQPSGSTVTYSGQTVSSILFKVLSNGYLDTSFNFTAAKGITSETIRSMSKQSDNNIVYLGSVHTGLDTSYIERIDANGAKDTSFTGGTITLGVANKVYVLSTGKILMLGSFRSYSGYSCNYLLRINSNGTPDTTWCGGGNPLSGATNGRIYDVVELSNGQIMVAGDIDTYNGTTDLRSLIRLNSDGTLDTSYPFGSSSFNSFRGARTLALQSDDKLLVGGNFTSYNGVSANGIIRLNSDGSRDTSFDVGTGISTPSTSNFVNNIIIQPSGKVILNGRFSSYNGLSIPRNIVRLRSNGLEDMCPIQYYYYSLRQYDCSNSCAVISPDLVGRSLTPFSTTSGTYYKFSGYSNVYQVQTEITPEPGSYDINMDTILNSSSVCGDACT
jgi:uncharacterized delta-60 repeat protein